MTFEIETYSLNETPYYVIIETGVGVAAVFDTEKEALDYIKNLSEV